jgi:beta-lactamase regulating signal transducer with metallopeptidase domain
MNDFLDAIVSNAIVLLAGATLLLTAGCLAVAAHRSPVHRQRLAESAIAATLIWAILAVTPLPRPLARGYLADLTRATAPKATPTIADPPAAVAATSSVSSTPADAKAIRAQLALARTLVLTTPVTTKDVVFDSQSCDCTLPPDWQTVEMEPQSLAFVPGDCAVDLVADDDSHSATPDDSCKTPAAPAVLSARLKVGAAASPAPAEAAVIVPSLVEVAPSTPSTAEVEPTGLAARLAASARAHWKLLLFGAYLLGVSICAGWILLGRGLLAVIVGSSQRPEEWLEELFADLCDERDSRQARLLVSRRYPRAMSFGIFRPTIVLPAAQCVPQNAEILRHVLRHELVHIDRRDAWGTLLFNVSFLMLFFHPAFWWLRSRARMSAELLADEWAASCSSRDEYARELIAFVRATRRATFMPAGATGVLGSTPPFSRRIEMLIRRERPLETHSSSAWRIVSSGVLGGLIIAMAASLGRTAQDDPPTDDKTTTVHVDATNVTADSDPDHPQKINVVATADDDDNIKVIVKDDDDDDDDAADAHKHAGKEVERMQKAYERLARKSAELQKQMAKLQQALEVARSGGEHKPSVTTDEAPSKKDKKHIEKRVIVKDGKGGVVTGDGPGVLRFDVDGKKFVIATPPGKDGEEKGTVSVKTNKKDGKEGEETTIELKTDEGEMILEIGPDHLPKIKKMKGFGESAAEIEGLKKSLESLKGLGDLKELGQLKALEQLKDLGDLKELGQLQGLEQLKELGKLNFDIRILDDGDSPEGKHHGDKRKNKEGKKHIKPDEDSSAHATPDKIDVEKMKEDIRAQVEQNVHRAHAQAHKAQMEALKAQLEAKRRELENLQKKLNKEQEETEGGPSTKRKTERRSFIVRNDDSAKPWVAKAVEPKVVIAKPQPKAMTGRMTVPVRVRTEVAAVEPRAVKATASADSSSDPMRLADLVSDAIAQLEQARATVEDAHGDADHRHVAESRVHSAERKVRLLGRIAHSLHAQATTQGKRTNNQHDQDEIDSKLRILDLIQSDVDTALGKAATSVTPAVPSLPAGMPVVQVPREAPVAPVAPLSPIAPIAPVASIPVSVVVAVPAAAPVPAPAAVPKPIAVPAPAAAPVPSVPALPAAPAKPPAK